MDTKISLDNIDFNYINLSFRDDRKKHMEEELTKISITAKRYEAIPYKELANYILPDFDFSSYKKNDIAPFMSHYNLMKEHTGNKILGVFEDDCVFCHDFKDRMLYIENNFDKEWDMFFLNSFYHSTPTWHKDDLGKDFDLTDIKYIHKTYGLFCCHSYLINPKSINKIEAVMKEYCGKSYVLDHLWILIQPYLNCYAFTPGMTTQYTNYSDVAESANKEQTESMINACGPHIYCENLNDFDYDNYFLKH